MAAPRCGDLAAERRVLQQSCGAEVAGWTQDLRQWRYRRALSFEWASSPRLAYYTNLFGVGHTLPVAYQLHRLCMELRRYCYVKLYDTDFERFFTYEGGLSWDLHHHAERARWGGGCAARACGNRSVAQLTLESTQAGRRHFWNRTLLRALADPALAAPRLLVVRVLGHLPSVDRLPRTSRCFNRFVTAPPRWLARVRVPARAVHLRTGFADVIARVSKVVQPDGELSSAWFTAACGRRPFHPNGSAVWLLSDSPGVLRYARSVVPGVSTSAIRASGEPTRSWFTTREMKFAALEDVVVAGMASQLDVAPQLALQEVRTRSACGGEKRCLVRRTAPQVSRFQSAITGRSVCISQLKHLVPECQQWPEVFVRDMTSWLNIRGSSTIAPTAHIVVHANRSDPNATESGLGMYVPRRWPQLLAILPRTHPCSRLSSGVECYLSFVAAMK